jgi:hypothetical protein
MHVTFWGAIYHAAPVHAAYVFSRGRGEEVARSSEAELSSQISRESVNASWLELVHFPPTEGDTPGQEHPPSRTSLTEHER